jgi:hypothetical protein
MNRWGIPTWLEESVRARDKTCVYCGVKMIGETPRRGPRRTAATWEHIINDASIVTLQNVALCCAACNSSKGTKNLRDWLRSDYCKEHGINQDTVAAVVREALKARRKAEA